MTKQTNEKEPTGLPVTVPTCTAKDTAGNEVTGYYVLLHIPETDGHGTVKGYRSVPSIFCDSPGNREGNHWHTIDPSTLRMDNAVQIPATSDALVLLDYLLAIIIPKQERRRPMMYFIQRINTWSPANQKCRLLQDFVKQFENTLIADDISRDALVEDIRRKVEELNQAYPRTKPLVVDFDICHRDYVSCKPEHNRIEDQYAFTFHIHPVRRTYRFSEKAAASLLKEGGDQ